MATILFVHGTGVRRSAYVNNCAVIQAALELFSPEHSLEPCLWGDSLGSRTPSLSIPDQPPRTGNAPPTDDCEIPRWRLLYADPFFELRLLRNSPRPHQGVLALGGRHAGNELWYRIERYLPSPRVMAILTRWHLDQAWKVVWEPLIASPIAKEAAQGSPTEVSELACAIARAVVAGMIVYRIEEGEPVIHGHLRDELTNMLVEDWQAQVAGLASFLSRCLADLPLSLGTVALAHKRGDVTQSASPAIGDILLYQARGEAIRSYIHRTILHSNSEVFLLAHSLGGIACVDLLATNEIPSVKGLITVGSQAPLLHEIGALWSLPPGAALPQTFPRWLNLYDPYDPLSYLAKLVFPNIDITDVKIQSGQPFPQSHSSYWSHPATWEAIRLFTSKG